MDAYNAEPSGRDLANGVLDGCRAIAREQHRFLVRLREFDLHRAYRALARGPHRPVDTPDWVQATCGMSRVDAQEALRIAYTLLNLPRIDAAFDAGELSYAKVKALASVATMQDEASLLALARVMSDAQVADHCARLARGRPGHSRRPMSPSGGNRGLAEASIYCAPVSAKELATHAGG